jgi:uncharacterized protein YegJ (DUF2314 family)
MKLSAANLLPLCLALLLLTACGGDPNFVKGTDKDLMERAMKKARETQGEFVQALAAKKQEASAFAIKKGFPVGSDEGGEHIWLNDVAWDGKVFTATVNNHPVETTAVKFGEQVTVRPEELSDWMYVEAGTLHGGTTLRALHYSSPAAEQNERRKQLPFVIPPIDF